VRQYNLAASRDFPAELLPSKDNKAENRFLARHFAKQLFGSSFS
jgi:hypothetical protein